jgi:microcystin-dependent protein
VASTLTPNYGWVQPQVGGDATTWGNELNNDLALIDAQVFANEQGVAPVGAGALWFTAAAPPNWLLCQGQSLATATYPALFAVIGYTFGGSGANFNLPPALNRFPIGAGSNALGATGGAATAALATANLPSHTHSISDPGHTHGASQPAHVHPDPGHTHGASGSQDPHSHTIPSSAGGGFGAAEPPQPMVANQGSTTTSTEQPNVYVSVGAAATSLQAAQPGVTVNAAVTNIPAATGAVGSGAAFSIEPPFFAVNFIIRFQ